MKRRIVAGISVLAVMVSVGWKLASHPETSAGLQNVSLIERSEHSHPGPNEALAAVRIRLSPSDFSDEIRAPAHEVPRIPLTAK
jgi:hypothetical protein